MGVPVDQLLAHAVNHVVQGELSGLLGHPGMKDHLKQHVSQLLLQMLRVALVDGLGGLIGLLQHIAPDALVGLFPVPEAAIRGAQQGHNLPQIVQAVRRRVF